jgi:hypothetical protein
MRTELDPKGAPYSIISVEKFQLIYGHMVLFNNALAEGLNALIADARSGDAKAVREAIEFALPDLSNAFAELLAVTPQALGLDAYIAPRCISVNDAQELGSEQHNLEQLRKLDGMMGLDFGDGDDDSELN